MAEGHPDKLADRISDRIFGCIFWSMIRMLVLPDVDRIALADQCVIAAGEFKDA